LTRIGRKKTTEQFKIFVTFFATRLTGRSGVRNGRRLEPD
jgi:hypothetical protein